MIVSENEISNLIDRKDYFKLKLYISLGYDLSLTDVNCDFVSKFGSPDHPAFEAVISNNIQALRKIKPNFINIKNNKGYSLLHWAIISHNYEAVHYLVELGIDIESVANTKDSVISLATRFNNTKAFFYLMSKYPKKNKQYLAYQNEKGFTSLHFACANKNVKIIKLILNICSHDLVAERNLYNATSLHWLVHGRKIPDQSKLKLVRVFCETVRRNYSGKLITDMLKTKNALGLTPLDWLDIYQHSKCQQFLARRL